MSVLEPEELQPEAPDEGTPAAEPVEGEEPDQEAAAYQPKDSRARALLDKYGGDADKAFAAAVEAQEMIGRQSNEIGELRQYRDYYEQQRQGASADDIARYAEQDPQQAAVMAYQQYGRGTAPYESALRAWGDADPFTAARFDYQAGLADYDRSIRPQMQQAELSAGLNQIIAKYPDFQEYGDAILREAQHSPVVRALQSQGQQIGADVIEHLYLAAKGRASTAQSGVQAADSALARQQKLNAGVASATAARPQEPPPMDEDDAFRAEYVRVAREMGLLPQE